MNATTLSGLAQSVKKQNGSTMLSARTRRTLGRIWMGLAFVFFVARCGDQIMPLYARLTGKPVHAETVVNPASARSTSSLRIATWNLEWLDAPGKGAEHRTLDDLRRLSFYAERLNADIIAVQEVADEKALEYVFGKTEYTFYLTEKGGGQRTGFVVRRSLDASPMPEVKELAVGGLRSGADLRVRVGNQELRLLSIHLKAFCVTDSLDKSSHDCEKLKEQVPALESWIDARAASKTPFIVLGDFNRHLDDQDELWRELDDGQPAGLTLTRADHKRESLCESRRRGRPFIDHVVLGGDAKRWFSEADFRELRYEESDRAAHVKLSDHCPVLVELHTKSS